MNLVGGLVERQQRSLIDDILALSPVSDQQHLLHDLWPREMLHIITDDAAPESDKLLHISGSLLP